MGCHGEMGSASESCRKPCILAGPRLLDVTRADGDQRRAGDLGFFHIVFHLLGARWRQGNQGQREPAVAEDLGFFLGGFAIIVQVDVRSGAKPTTWASGGRRRDWRGAK